MSTTMTMSKAASASTSEDNQKPSRSLWEDAFIRLKKNKAAVISAYFILFICMVAIFAENLAPYPFDEQYMDKVLNKPSTQHWLGTDALGRDLFSRIIYGARMSMAVAIYTSLISLAIGAIYGAISGWVGGRLDSLLMRIIDILYSIPSMVLLILVKVIFDSIQIFEDPERKAYFGIVLALSLVGWVTLARVVRGQVLQVKQMTYVEAAKSLGANPVWIVIKHVMPNILGPIIVLLTFQIPSNILFESFLSFIGLGLQPPYSSWGVLASSGYQTMRSYPHLIIFPSFAIFVTMLAFNFLGDGLRDALDPQMKGR